MASAMSIRQQKKLTRRRIAAVSFLSNISLDGTYEDTKYAIFNKSKSASADCRTDAGKRKEDENGRFAPSSSSSSSPAPFLPPPSLSSSSSSAECTNDFSNTGLSTVQESQYEQQQPASSAVKAEESVHSSAVQEKNLDVPQNLTPTKRWRALLSESAPPFNLRRASSYSGEAEKVMKRKIISFTNEPSSGIKESIERLTDKSRQSHSLSSSSSEGVTKETGEIRFLSPCTRRQIKNERVLIVSKKKVPVAVCSFIPYSRESQQGVLNKPEILTEDSRTRHHSGPRPASVNCDGLLSLGLQTIAMVEEGQDVSYSAFLVPSSQARVTKKVICDTPAHLPEFSSLQTVRDLQRSVSYDPQVSQKVQILDKVSVIEEQEMVYTANLLDDPELQAGSYRTLLTFPSYRTSIIDYVKPSDLKKELNEKFKERFPQINLTLSKLRSLKKELKQIANAKCGTDLWTVAQAYVFFEKLILKYLINKQNRKLCAGACLILSAKLNDVKGQDITRLIQQIEDDFRLHRKELLAFEFACLVALEFSLHLSDSEVFPHYQRLLYNS